MGRFDAYGLPDAYPIPMCVCANSDSSIEPYNGSNVGIMDSSDAMSMIKEDSTILDFTTKNGQGLYPLGGMNVGESAHYLNVADDVTNDLMERLEFFDATRFYGALDNCLYVSATNNAPEDVKQVANGGSTDNYIVFGNLTNSGEGDLFAVYKDTV